jgi:hypothetical protein
VRPLQERRGVDVAEVIARAADAEVHGALGRRDARARLRLEAAPDRRPRVDEGDGVPAAAQGHTEAARVRHLPAARRDDWLTRPRGEVDAAVEAAGKR